MKILFSLCLSFLVFCCSLQTHALSAGGFVLSNTPNAKMQFSEGIDVHLIEKYVKFPMKPSQSHKIPYTDSMMDRLLASMWGKEKVGTLELQQKNKTGSIGGNIYLLGTYIRWPHDINEYQNYTPAKKKAFEDKKDVYYNTSTDANITFSVDKPGKYTLQVFPHDADKLKLSGPLIEPDKKGILLLDPAIGIHIDGVGIEKIPYTSSNPGPDISVKTTRKHRTISPKYNDSWMYLSPEQDIRIVMPYDEMILDIPYAGEYTLSFVYQYMNSQDDNGVFQQFFQE